jgi:serine/threonine-protein kinase
MATKEKFGRFVLLEELETSGLGTEYRAAKLAPAGLEKIVSLLRIKPAVSARTEAVKALMEHIKFAAQLHNPNVVRIHGIGKVDAAYYVSHELIEGKSLRAVFERTRQDGFPFSVDHTLLIASKACSALEYAHSRKVDGGARYFHGFLTPGCVLVSYEGEVRVRGFGVWPSRIREAGAATPEEDAYLAPEQAADGRGDPRSDVWAIGALLFEMLTGVRASGDGKREDAVARLAQARMKNTAGDEEGLPRPIADILRKALAADPAARFAEVQELRKAVDALLFSGEFSPTTFNLAFFMHSVFRQDIDREARALREEKEASYADYLADEPAPAPGAAVPPATAVPVAPLAEAAAPAPVAWLPERRASPPAAPVVAPPAEASAPAPLPAVSAPLPAATPSPAASPAPTRAAHDVSPQQAAAGFTFHRPPAAPRRNRGALAAVGTAALLLIGAGAGYMGLRGRPAVTEAALLPPSTTLSPEAVAAMARVKELEQRLQAIETEKAAAEARAAEEARLKVEAQAAARGQRADAAAVARAQEEARRRAQAEQDRLLREEQERLEAEQRAAEERLAEERRREEEQRAAALAAAAVVTTTLPPPTAPPTPAVRPGTLVNLTDPGVVPPVLDRAAPIAYPPIALRQRLEGTVELNVLIDERGNVSEAQVVSGAGGRAGLNEAAVESVRRRKYRPGTKEGVAVKVWIPVRVQFRLPN